MSPGSYGRGVDGRGERSRSIYGQRLNVRRADRCNGWCVGWGRASLSDREYLFREFLIRSGLVGDVGEDEEAQRKCHEQRKALLAVRANPRSYVTLRLPGG